MVEGGGGAYQLRAIHASVQLLYSRDVHVAPETHWPKQRQRKRGRRQVARAHIVSFFTLSRSNSPVQACATLNRVVETQGVCGGCVVQRRTGGGGVGTLIKLPDMCVSVIASRNTERLVL
jgi:hypothetical protein